MSPTPDSSRVGRVRTGLGLSRPAFAALLGAATQSVLRWETDPRWAEPRGLTGVVLNVIEERLEAGEVTELKRLAELATTDLQTAIRRLMGSKPLRRGRV